MYFVNKKESVIIKPAVFPGRLPGKVSGVGRTFFAQSFHPSRLISQGIFAVCHQLDIFQDRDDNKEEPRYGVNSALLLSHLNKCTMHRALLFVLRMGNWPFNTLKNLH